MKMECWRWPAMLLILGRSGTQYVAMVTKLFSSYCATPLVEPYCKNSNIKFFVTNWLRYRFSSYLIKIWLSIWCHHLANLHILKTWISLEWKEIFEKSKQHFSSHTQYFSYITHFYCITHTQEIYKHTTVLNTALLTLPRVITITSKT